MGQFYFILITLQCHLKIDRIVIKTSIIMMALIVKKQTNKQNNGRCNNKLKVNSLILLLQVSQQSVKSRADGSNISLFSSHVYNNVGRYQGAIVGIINVNKPSVNVSRDILKEFKEVCCFFITLHHHTTLVYFFFRWLVLEGCYQHFS